MRLKGLRAPARHCLLPVAGLAVGLAAVAALDNQQPRQAEAAGVVKHCKAFAEQFTVWNATASLPKWDPANGTLTTVKVTVKTSITQDFRYENLAPGVNSVSVTGDSSVRATLPNGSFVTATTTANKNDTLPAYDNVTDYVGASGRTYVNVVTSGNAANSNYTPVSDFQGPGGSTVSIPVRASGPFTVDADIANVAAQVITKAQAEVCVEYTYDGGGGSVPSCTAPVVTVANPKTVQVTAQDAVSGIATIDVIANVNATVTISSFTPGTTSPVTITGVKQDQSQPAQVQVKVTSTNGNWVICDPILLTLSITSGSIGRGTQFGTATTTVTAVPSAEGMVTLTNLNPGVSSVVIVVNGVTFTADNLNSNEVRNINVAAAMRPGDNNTMTFTATGPVGSKVDVMVWEGRPNSGGRGSAARPTATAGGRGGSGGTTIAPSGNVAPQNQGHW